MSNLETRHDSEESQASFYKDLDIDSILKRLLKIPRVQISDNLFYQPGAVFVHNTAFVDSSGNPVYKAISEISDIEVLDQFISEN